MRKTVLRCDYDLESLIKYLNILDQTRSVNDQ